MPGQLRSEHYLGFFPGGLIIIVIITITNINITNAIDSITTAKLLCILCM